MSRNSHIFGLLSLVPHLGALGRNRALGRLFAKGSVMMGNDDIAAILTSVKTIAVVGWSPKADRPSNSVARFLQAKGFRVIPVNPGQAGLDAGLATPVAARLSDIGEPVDMVDIFRRSDEVYGVVEEGLAIGAKVIWMQLGIEDPRAAALARAQGAKVVMDACPAIEMPRLGL